MPKRKRKEDRLVEIKYDVQKEGGDWNPEIFGALSFLALLFLIVADVTLIFFGLSGDVYNIRISAKLTLLSVLITSFLFICSLIFERDPINRYVKIWQKP